MARSDFFNRKTIAWAFYDWANSAFALSVLAVLFPLFLGSYWSAGDPGTVVTERLGWITSGASAIVVLIAPIFGTIADAGGYRKRFLFILGSLGAVTTAALGAVGEGSWLVAGAFYTFALIGYYGSTIFYDSLIVDVCAPRYYSFVSSLGFSIGYLGGAVLLAIHVWMLVSPETFGIADTTVAMKAAFVSVGVWWAVFMLPILYFVPEGASSRKVSDHVVRAAYRELKDTFSRIRQYRNVVIFLVAYWLYIGGVFTVISMAVNFGQRLGFTQQDLVMALMITNFAGFPATLLYGWFGHRYGAKAGIYFALAVYIVIASLAVFITDVKEFYIMAIVIGCVQGGVQGLSRSLFASLIPSEQPGEFFGFYNMVTKLSHVLGPALVAIGAMMSDNPKVILLALLPLFIGGAMLLTVVRGGGKVSE